MKAAQSEATAALSDDVFWHNMVNELGLAPDLDALHLAAEEESASRPPFLQRVEQRMAELPSGLRHLALGSLLLSLVALAAAVLISCKGLFVAVGSTLPLLLGDRPLEFHASVAHVLVLGLMLVLLLTARSPSEPQGLVARRAWSQFQRGWLCLWSAWLLLYLWMAAYWGLRDSQVQAADFFAQWGAAVADLLNVAGSAVFFYLFLVLDRPSVKADGLPERDRAFQRSLAGVAVICGAAALISILGRFELLGLTTLGPTVGSILVAMSMAFFFGRLSDSHLRVRRALLAPLYFYVALQMLWHLFVMAETPGAVQSQAANALVLFGALGLKVYFFALLTRWIQDGKLQTYFDEVAYPRYPSDIA